MMDYWYPMLRKNSDNQMIISCKSEYDIDLTVILDAQKKNAYIFQWVTQHMIQGLNARECCCVSSLHIAV